ncbi:SLC13 family permease [Desulfovibrio oxyclinae]|jgi:sodium-dependent dicarboxylate transporter 2/3/5|uniref:SLC13 family permease n=1 Tax=Desulfovibrio oxyclinae TaxID=63560 RepID=UPI00037C5AE3|nr:DASS family sodium-coupled anion symporter [Desulfovibrio oxyclinae]
MIHWAYDKRWLLITLAAVGILLLLPVPPGLTSAGWKVLVMTLAATTLFIKEPVPLPSVALLIVLGQIFLLGLDSSDVARSLMKDAVLFIMGSLMLAVAMVKQQLDKRLALVIVKATGTNTYRIALGISVVSGLLASFIGEHTVAAMMLPVALTLIQLAEEDEERRRRLALLFLFSISYACCMAGIGTPSGGARNAIMIEYWGDFFHKPSDPATAIYDVGYGQWMLFAYPVFLAQLPFMHWILRKTFPAPSEDLSHAVRRLREQVGKQGSLQGRHYATILIFLLTVTAWILFSTEVGMGTIAIAGAASFLLAGLVRWEDLNSGVNWGVVLLYGAAISLGQQMQETGAAAWVAAGFLDMLVPLGLGSGIGLLACIMLLTTAMTNTMSNGAAVAVLGPIVLSIAVEAGANPLAAGFITAMASSFAYLTVIGTPASSIVRSSGYLASADFLKAGWRLALMSFIILIIFAKFYWPFLGG